VKRRRFPKLDHSWATLTCLVMAAAVTTAVSSQTPSRASQVAGASILYCQVGGVGLQPPDDPERFFASAVIEIRTPNAVDNPRVTMFDLIDGRGVARARLRRVVDVFEFTRPRLAAEGIAAYYRNSTGNRPWNGNLPAGVSRLQIRVAFDRVPQRHDILDLRCRLTFGPHTVARDVDSEWPT